MLTFENVCQVMTCANGDQGKALALAAARDTEALNPPHEYAPWVTMNGQPMRDAAYDLQSNVCKAYDAGDKVSAPSPLPPPFPLPPRV